MFLHNIKKTIALSLWVLLLIVNQLKAEQSDPLDTDTYSKLFITAQEDSYALGMHMDVLKDDSTILTIDEVSHAMSSHFTPYRSQFPNWGTTESAFWYRVLLINTLPVAQELVIEETSSWIDYINLYVQKRDGDGFDKWVVGDRFPFSERPIRHHNFLFTVTLAAGESRAIFMRVKGRTAMVTPVTVWKDDAFHAHDRIMAYIFGAYFGVLAIMFFYNLFLFFILKDTNYFYYILFILAAALTFSNSNGFSYMYLWPDYPQLMERIQTATISLFQLFGILFARRFFETRKNMQRINIVVNLMLISHLVLIILTFLLEDYILTFNIIVLMAVINAPILLSIGILAWIRGNRSVRYYLMAWSSSVVGLVVTGLTLQGNIDYNFFSYNGIFIGVLLDVTFLSFALAERIHILQNEKNQAQMLVQETLTRAKNELEDKVLERTVDLQKAKEEADRANEVKLQFLSSMSHELRTPMNAILGFAQLLYSDKQHPLSGIQKDNVSQILASGKHLLVLINDVLDLSRIEAGRLSINLEHVQLRETLDNTLQLIAPAAAKQQVTLFDHTKISRDCYVLADPTRLTQVILNLLSNAVKFNRHRGSVVLTAEQEKNMLRLNVVDTGSGIKPDKITTLFEPFERLDSDRRGIEGTGIGLSISRQLMGLMNGSINVKSNIGKGSTFSIEIPLLKPGFLHQNDLSTEQTHYFQREISHHEIESGIVENSGNEDLPLILYVEDNTINQKLMRYIFSRLQNTRLMVADTGRSGVELTKSERPALVIMDIHLPDISGYEALNEIRQDPDTSHIPVVAVSANATADDIRKGQNAGFIEYLAKPVDIGQLTQLIEKTVVTKG